MLNIHTYWVSGEITVTHLDTKKAAKELGVSNHTLVAWRIKGFGPKFRKLGRRVLYEQNDLVAWADKQSRTSTADSSSTATA